MWMVDTSGLAHTYVDIGPNGRLKNRSAWRCRFALALPIDHYRGQGNYRISYVPKRVGKIMYN